MYHHPFDVGAVLSIRVLSMAVGAGSALVCGAACGPDGDASALAPGTTTSSATQTTSTGPDPKLVDGGPGCADAMAFFAEQLWGPVVEQRCMFCHYAGGPAGASDLVLVPPDGAADWEYDFAAVCAMAWLDTAGLPRLLAKPSYATDHGGGLRAPQGSDAYAALEQFVALARALDGCRCPYEM